MDEDLCKAKPSVDSDLAESSRSHGLIIKHKVKEAYLRKTRRIETFLKCAYILEAQIKHSVKDKAFQIKKITCRSEEASSCNLGVVYFSYSN